MFSYVVCFCSPRYVTGLRSAENHGTGQIFQPACAVAAKHIEIVDSNGVDGLHRADLQTLRAKAVDRADDVGALIL